MKRKKNKKKFAIPKKIKKDPKILPLEKEEEESLDPHKKKIKDMTDEEYKEYKREYAKKYNEKKRQEAEEQMKDRMSVRGRKAYEEVNGERSEESNEGRKMSSFSENQKFMINPRCQHMITRFEGFRSYCELKASLNMNIFNDGKRLTLNIGFWILPPSGGANAIFAENVEVIDFTDHIKKISTSAYREICQNAIEVFYENKLKKMDLVNFCKLIIENSGRDKYRVVDTLWECIDKDWARKKEFNRETLASLVGIPIKRKYRKETVEVEI